MDNSILYLISISPLSSLFLSFPLGSRGTRSMAWVPHSLFTYIHFNILNFQNNIIKNRDSMLKPFLAHAECKAHTHLCDIWGPLPSDIFHSAFTQGHALPVPIEISFFIKVKWLLVHKYMMLFYSTVPLMIVFFPLRLASIVYFSSFDKCLFSV